MGVEVRGNIVIVSVIYRNGKKYIVVTVLGRILSREEIIAVVFILAEKY